MLDIVTGQPRNAMATRELAKALGTADLTGTLYIGYPTFSSLDGIRTVEALLTCEEHGVVAFDFLNNYVEPDSLRESQDEIAASITQKLLSYKSLRDGRQLAMEINVVTICPNPPRKEICENVTTPDAALAAITPFAPLSTEYLRMINAAIQRVATIKPVNKRLKVSKTNSRGAILKEIEAQIANLDLWQKRAAIESPEGPQRIRGLAGSGKTIVLALKAAYLLGQNPSWDIAITFQTRSLYQQFKDLVRRFCFDQFNDEPDWSKLRILHSWGSARQPGIYSEIAAANSLPIRDLTHAKQRYGIDTGFQGICQEALAELADKKPAELFDVVLIDEAQDLPQQFFELLWKSTREPKRIIWAYDELQNLGSYSMAPPEELFGADSNGKPHVPNLDPLADGAKRDIVLPVCYRNTPWVLTTAHALGMGIYRTKGLIQFFDNPDILHEVGYKITEGTLDFGQQVVLARKEDSYPPYFVKLLKPNDAIKWQFFSEPEKQYAAVADQIKKNLAEDELDARDILVILPDPLDARQEAAKVRAALGELGIPSHLAGVTTSVDELFLDNSVAITGIFRAKGNEAPMVYVLNGQYCAGTQTYTSVRSRNILFTAITRSRAWVRIMGYGDGMSILAKELQEVVQNNYCLAFRVPTREQLETIRKIHRDKSKEEVAKIRRAEKTLSDLLEMINRGEVTVDDLPIDLRDAFNTLLGTKDDDDDAK